MVKSLNILATVGQILSLHYRISELWRQNGIIVMLYKIANIASILIGIRYLFLERKFKSALRQRTKKKSNLSK
jgi:hypothetical protein